MANLSPRFAVKLRVIYKPLKFNNLQKHLKITNFVKYFYRFLSIQLSIVFFQKTTKKTKKELYCADYLVYLHRLSVCRKPLGNHCGGTHTY